MFLTDCLELVLRRRGSGEGLVAGDERWTWAEAVRRSASFAEALVGLGVFPGDRIGLLASNGIEFWVATFAGAAAGAVLVPLNDRLAARELGAVLDDAGAPLLLADAEHEGLARAAAAAAGRPPRCVRIAGGRIEPSGEAGAGPVPQPPAPDTPAHLYYTSGTTGRPKGVVLTHGNLAAHAANAVAELALTEHDRWAHIAPMFHLADAWATVALTAVGGTHVHLPRFDPLAALDLLERERITLTNLVPTMLNAMVRHPSARGRDFSSLRLLLSGGAPLAPALVREVEEVFGCTYAQTYGLTETSPYLTISLLDGRYADMDEATRRSHRGRTGRPFRGVEVEVVDAEDRTVPADDRTVGEVRARGPTVTPGYWKQPVETAAALRGGWLYTGDLAVVDRFGSLRIVDRKKDMILTGGENVYTSEVEAVLYEHPAVLEAAVFGLPDERWGERVCAALVLRAGAAFDRAELEAFCRARIGGYKLPRSVFVLDALPKTGSGKISKQLLRRRFAEAPA